MLKKIAALTLVLSAVGITPAYADGSKSEGPKNEKEAAACRAVLYQLMPMLANSGICNVQKDSGPATPEQGPANGPITERA